MRYPSRFVWLAAAAAAWTWAIDSFASAAELRVATFRCASALNDFLMLGNVATQFEEPIEFDPVAMKIVNNPEADGLLWCEYRQGWKL